MPKAYERVRDAYLRNGASLEQAKKLAAMWWNAHHKIKNPWTKEKKRKK